MKKLTAVVVALMMMVCGCAACIAEQQTITREEALKATLDYTGLKEDQITLTKSHKDWDDVHQVWEIEFFSNGIEYDFDVDVLTGRIVKADQDREYRHDHDRDDDWDDWFDFD